jgi:glycosyltransferase involved in cell wall biosynthesis
MMNDRSVDVTVVTAACGSAALKRCIASVQKQTYPDIDHIVVADGSSRVANVSRQMPSSGKSPRLLRLPHETGRNGFNGHRIYASLPFLVKSKYIIFLDEDNFIDKNHVQSLVRLAETHNLDWAYSLRKIVSKSGSLLLRDDCDSLGIWGSWYGAQNHIDANCYLLRTSVARETSPIWDRPAYEDILNPDKALCRWLLFHKIKGFTTGEYTLNYRLGGNERSVKVEYFQEGNRVMKSLYKYFPWRRPILQEIGVGKEYRRIVAKHESVRPEILRYLRAQRRKISI